MSENVKLTKEQKKAEKEAQKAEKLRRKKEKAELKKAQKAGAFCNNAAKTDKEAPELEKERRNKPRIGDPVLPVKEEKGIVSITLSAFNGKEAPGPQKKKLEKQRKLQEKLSKEQEKAAKEQEERKQKKARKEKKEQEKAERKRLEAGDLTLYERFENASFVELEQLLHSAGTREERAFYRSLLNLKLQIEQEKVIGEVLL